MNNNEIIITDWLLKTKNSDIISRTYVYKLTCLCVEEKKIMRDMIYICEKLKDIILGEIAFFGVHIISSKEIDFCILHNEKKLCFKKVILNNIDDKYLSCRLCERYLENLTITFFMQNNWIYTGNISNNTFISEKYKNVFFNNVSIEVRDKLKINWYINDDNIVLSFKVSYRIIEEKNISNSKENIVQNLNPIYLINKETNKRLQFIKYENEICQDFIIKDKKCSLFNYIDKSSKDRYKNLKNSKVVTAYFCDSIISKENKRVYHFPSDFLHLERNDIRNTIDFSKKFPNNKMNDMIKLFENMFHVGKLQYSIDGLYIKNHEYENYDLPFPEEIRTKINYTNKEKKTKSDIYTFHGEIKYYILHSSVVTFNIINSFSNLIKSSDFGIMLQQEKILFYDKPTTYLKDIKLTNKKIVDKWIKEVIEHKMAIIFVTNDDKDTSRYEDIKEFFKDKNIGTQCISLKIINKMLKDYENNSSIWMYYMNNIIPQIAIKSGLSPKFYLHQDLSSKCFVGIDVSHIPFINNNGYNIKHTSGSVSCIFDNDGYISFQDYGNIENGEKIVKEYYNIKNDIIKNNLYNEKNTINKILNSIITEYINKTGYIPKNVVIHRDGFCRESELELIHDYFKTHIEYNNIRYTVISILKHIDKKIYLWVNGEAKTSPIKAYINRNKNEAYMITSKPFNRDKISNPFKIKIVYTNDNYSIEKACKDVYLLSFPTHMKGIIKLRLPMTIHYSDESSTNRNRDYLENDIIYNKLLCP